MAQETLRILQDGRYTNAAGREVCLSAELSAAKAETVLYTPADALDASIPATHDTSIEVTRESTLAAAQRLAPQRPVALNFASAKNPGGGFLNGAEAQEESLARSSGLYACIAGSPMYELHRKRRDALYTHHVIYSPAVPVFRDDAGALLDAPYACAFLTSPAPNAGVVLTREPSRFDELERAMRERMRRVLMVALRHEHDTIILGAWGCGVFRNDPKLVARWFAETLPPRAFARVVFAVLDRRGDCYDAFRERFQS